MGFIERVCPRISEQDEVLDWPWWVPLGSVAVAMGTTLKALADRDALLSPAPETLFGLLAVGTWLIDLSGRSLARPLFAALVITAVTGLLLLDPTRDDFAPFLLVAMIAEVAVTASLAVTAGAAVAAMSALAVMDAATENDGALVWCAGIAAAAALGALLQSRWHLLEQERAVAAGLAAQAAAEERQRIAREVHDVIAHSLSVTMLHVTGTRHLLETEGDVDEAVEALRDAERLGRQAMTDIRRTVGLLGQATEPTAPMPGLVDLADLVADFRSAGMDVGHRLVGDPAPLSPATDLGLYRIVQESLANVAKHAPGTRAEVMVDVAGDPLRVRIRNGSPASGGRAASGGARQGARQAGEPGRRSRSDDRPTATTTGRAPQADPAVRPAETADNGFATTRGTSDRGSDRGGAGGLGLPGMRQRVELLGGELRAGPDGDGWCVEVTMPRDAAAAAVP